MSVHDTLDPKPQGLPSPSAISPDHRPILFLHIPKTAGTSFVTMLQNLFGESKVLRLYMEDPQFGAKLQQVIRIASPDIACVNGHLPIHHFRDHLNKFRPFTLLRDPIDRVLSLYRFLSLHPDPESMGLHRGFSFDDFMACRAPAIFPQLHNGMCRALCGDPRAYDPRTPIYWDIGSHTEVLEAAIQNLRSIEFGLVEQMARTCRLLEQSWGLPFALGSTTVNTTERDEAAEDWRDIHRIVRRNTLDITLYARAIALFKERFAALGAAPGSAGTAMIFAPPLDRRVAIADIPGRQGFLAHEHVGLSWLDRTALARIYFRAPVAASRIILHTYGISPTYPFDQIDIRLNGQPIRYLAMNRSGNWCDLETEPLKTAGDVNLLTIRPPFFVPVRFIAPAAADDRYLAIAIAGLTFLS